jgi:hypothetical protein
MYKMVHMGRVRVLNVLAEATLIVFSILLALYTNHWREERAVHQRLQTALAEIRVELQQNQAILQNVLPYHQAEMERIGRYLDRPDLARQVQGKNLIELLKQSDALEFHGVWNPQVSPSDLSDTAWKSAIASGVLPLMQPDLLKALTSYYSSQETGVLNTLHTMNQIYLGPEPYDRSQTITMLRTLQGTFRVLADQEQSLLQLANHTLQAMPNK